MVDQLRFVASHLQLPVYGLQSTVDVPQNSIEEVATFYVQVKLLISKHCIFYSYIMPACSKTITPRCCGRPDALLHEAEGRVQ